MVDMDWTERRADEAVGRLQATEDQRMMQEVERKLFDATIAALGVPGELLLCGKRCRGPEPLGAVLARMFPGVVR